jgi:hypothetical protein
MTTNEATLQLEQFLAQVQAEKEDHERRMNCKHGKYRTVRGGQHWRV